MNLEHRLQVYTQDLPEDITVSDFIAHLIGPTGSPELRGVIEAAVAVRDSFAAWGQAKGDPLVIWRVDPVAMRSLIIALHSIGRGHSPSVVIPDPSVDRERHP